MQGTDIEDVSQILRDGCNEAGTVFLASLKNLQIGISTQLAMPRI
jgi:hypothetical protein